MISHTAKAKREALVSKRERSCCVCKRSLPLDRFIRITVRDKRCKPGHTWEGFTYDCRDCRAERKRQTRRQRGARARLEIAAEVAEKERRRLVERERRAAERAARPRQSHAEKIAREVKRQRERYNTDPEYQALIKAKKIRRKRAQRGTQVERVNRELVAERDNWTCSICGGAVTRETWSLDHVVPLAKGGEHTYENVALAHLRCNSRKGAKLPKGLPPPPLGSSDGGTSCG